MVSEAKGVVLSDVTAASPAAKAGLKRGDVVLKLSGQVTDSSAKLRNRFAASGPDTEVSIELVRNADSMRPSAK